MGRPNVGENRPSRVRADVSLTLRVGDSVKHEWESEFNSLVWSTQNYWPVFSIILLFLSLSSLFPRPSEARRMLPDNCACSDGPESGL